MVDQGVLSFSTLYTDYFRKSFLFAKSYVHDEVAAEDIASEVLLKMWTILKEEQTEFSKLHLLTMLKNRSLDYLRHQLVVSEAMHQLTALQQRELEFRLSTLEACDPKEILSVEVERIMQQTLASLPRQTRRIFEMSRFDNKSNKEIANELGVSVKAVEYHITKTLKVLRVTLKDYLPCYYLLFLLH